VVFEKFTENPASYYW